MPELRTYNPSWLATQPVAHRGLHSPGVPENSLAAFKAAAAAGYAIELDVQLTSDGQLVVFHDFGSSRRLTRQQVNVRTSTAAELISLQIAGTRHTIPLLSDVLKTIRGRVPLAIEIKTGTSPKRIGPVLVKLLANYRGEVAVGSFDPRILVWFRFHARHIPRAQIAGSLSEYRNTYPAWVRRTLRTMPLNLLTRPNVIAFDIRDYPTGALTFWEHILDIPVILWVVKSNRQLTVAKRDACNVLFERIRPPASRR